MSWRLPLNLFAPIGFLISKSHHEGHFQLVTFNHGNIPTTVASTAKAARSRADRIDDLPHCGLGRPRRSRRG